MSDVSSPLPPATAAASQPPRRPSISRSKALLFMAGLVLSLPVMIIYGAVGKVLTTASTTHSALGMATLFAFAVAIAAQVGMANVDHAEELTDAEVDPTLGLAFAAQVIGLLLGLLYGQWKLHKLVMCVIDESTESPNAVSLLIETAGPFALLIAMRRHVYQWKHWDYVPTIYLYIFFGVYCAVPLLVAMSHAQVWVQARYSELERIERELYERNMKCKFEMSKIAGLGTVFVPCTAPKEKGKPTKTLVLTHGFAGGNALWSCNLEALAQNYDVYAVEWMGKGRSDRPTFPSYDLEEADRIFVEAFEEWRKELKLNKFYLGGHSMGAMFVSSYCVQYPEHVEHLVLISPAGVPHPPAPRSVPLGLKIFRYLWSLKLTPMSLARFAGPFGPWFICFLARTRVSFMPETSCIRRGGIPVDSLGMYWYHNWAMKASGEIAMHTHLFPGVFAKKPICTILTPKTVKVPITFLYGGGPDWMDSIHGEELAKTFSGHQRVEVLKVPLAGHQVFMDNVDAFNSMLHTTLSSGAHK